jgi:hypothetical protein
MSDLIHIYNGMLATTAYVATGDVGMSSSYGHTFGGPPRHNGVIAGGAPEPVQLFYLFDLNDPNCCVKIPGCRWLPLYNAIRFDQSPLAYRIDSDSQITILKQTSIMVSREAWVQEYPQHLPELRVTVGKPEPIVFDEDLLELWDWDKEDHVAEKKSPTLHELIALATNVNQQLLPRSCANPACANSNVHYLAVFSNQSLDDVGIVFFGGECEYFKIVYYICYSCFTISTLHLAN